MFVFKQRSIERNEVNSEIKVRARTTTKNRMNQVFYDKDIFLDPSWETISHIHRDIFCYRQHPFAKLAIKLLIINMTNKIWFVFSKNTSILWRSDRSNYFCTNKYQFSGNTWTKMDDSTCLRRNCSFYSVWCILLI